MVFFFCGPNSFASRHKLREMIETYRRKTGSDLGLERIDGATAEAGELRACLTTMPFLVSSRLVVIEKLGANKTVASQASELVKLVPESTVAVFYETEVDSRSQYFKTLAAQAKAVKFEPLTAAALGRWIRSEVGNRGGTIEAPALNLLVEIAGDDQWRLEQEIIKLVNYRSTVTVESVKALVVTTPQQTIFDLVEAMSAKRVKSALVILRDLLQQRTSEIYILTMITWQLRNLLLAKTAGAVTAPELAKRAGMSPYVAGRALTRQRDFSEDDLRRAYLAAVETDYAIKDGQGAPELLVERLVYKVAAGQV